MSDLRLYNYRNKKIIAKAKMQKHEIKAILEKNLEELLGINVLFRDYKIPNSSNVIEILGYDENNQIVVVEYRTGKFTNTINKGLVFLDYIRDNLSLVKSFINEKYGYDLGNSLIYLPRLIVVGDDFNKYDEYAIGQMPYIVDFIRFQAYDNKHVLFEKAYQSKSKYSVKSMNLKGDLQNKIFEKLSEFVLSMGDEVCEIATPDFVAYRKIKNFMYLIVNNGLQIKLKMEKFETIELHTMEDLDNALYAIENCYDEN